MYCPLIVVLLTLAAIASVMAQSSTTSTSPAPVTPPVVEGSCKALDHLNNSALMETKTFTRNLDECTESKNETDIEVARVLVDLRKTLNGHECELAHLTDYPEILTNITSCALTITGFKFTESNMRTRFGLNDTLSFKFGIQQCKVSLEVMDCVENVYTGHLNATTKGHKNVYMRLFDGIASFCEEAWIDDDINSGQSSLPSFTLILGSALMIFKLTL